MRQGIWLAKKNRGFGWAKIQKKHAIYSKHSVGYVLKNPDGGAKDGKYRREYDAWANKITCVDGNCEVTDDRQVWVITDSKKRDGIYHTVKMRGNRAGVITAYCANPDFAWECPSWVDKAIGSQAPRASARTVWTYAPITRTQLHAYAKHGSAQGVHAP